MYDRIDIGFFTETFLNDSFNDAFLNNSNFYVIRGDRLGMHPKKSGGGVIVLYRKTLNISQVDIKLESYYKDHYCDVVCFDIFATKIAKYRVFLIYRPPDTNFVNTSGICQHLGHFLLPDNNIILGDFNCPDINWSSLIKPKVRAQLPVFNFAILHDFVQLVNFPTRVSQTGTNNTLDLILSQRNDVVINCKRMPPLLTSDHDTVGFHLEIESTQNSTTNKVKPMRFNYKLANYEAINQFLAAFNWERQLSFFGTIQSKYEHLTRILIETVETNCPLITDCKPKTDKQLSTLLRKRKHLRNDNRAYRHLQRDIRNRISELRTKSELKVLRSGSSKKFYGYIRDKIKANHSIPTLCDNGNPIAFSDLEKCEIFCNSFNDNYCSSVNPIVPPVFPRTKEKHLNIDFSAHRVYEYLKNVPSKTSLSDEKIPQLVLKKCALTLALPLSIIFRDSYDSGVIPKEWKRSVIVPVFKKGSKSSPKNYRPISLTSTICRVMEKMICDSVRTCFASYIDQFQFGFLKKRSCCLSLLNSISSWQKDLKNKKPVDVAYFDFQAAFDKLPHNKLILKLEALGMEHRAVNWFKCFLTGRSSRVRVGNSLSDSFITVTSGVPQGTVSGTLLFLLYVNDICNCIPEGVSYTSFADDLKSYTTCPERLQTTIDNIFSWSEIWDLPISKPKTSILHLGKNNPRYTYTMDGSIIQDVSEIRDLGLIVDERLTFESHINAKVKSANLLCKCILRSFNFKEPTNYTDLYCIYVRPILEYCSELYCPSSNSLLSSTIEQPLRSFTRSVFKRCKIPMLSYKDRLNQLEINSQIERRIFSDLILCYKLLYSLSYYPSNPLVLSTSLRHPLRLRCQTNLYVSDNFYFNRVQSLWNQIAPSLSTINLSVDVFKNILKNHNFVYSPPCALR
jgi:hypothetical protein